ncbi:hypothetical protein [Legionella tunisiensis]|uniref:hypothetical protein n=1 Tax=Legionella tunisiensis TaxID=1034944 RepID=UPI0003057739|nr:hypothetical protein [Legionella tunisiensis]
MDAAIELASALETLKDGGEVDLAFLTDNAQLYKSDDFEPLIGKYVESMNVGSLENLFAEPLTKKLA